MGHVHIIRHREAAALGLLLGAQQAEEHIRLTGERQLSGPSLLVLAGLTWRYEGLPRIGTASAMDDFVRAFAIGYGEWGAEGAG